MSRVFRYVIDEEALIDGLYAFVTEPRASVRNAMPIAEELREHPSNLLPWDLVEAMVLDGVEDRNTIRDLVHYVTSHLA